MNEYGEYQVRPVHGDGYDDAHYADQCSPSQPCWPPHPGLDNTGNWRKHDYAKCGCVGCVAERYRMSQEVWPTSTNPLCPGPDCDCDQCEYLYAESDQDRADRELLEELSGLPKHNDVKATFRTVEEYHSELERLLAESLQQAYATDLQKLSHHGANLDPQREGFR